jgi:hypothetical protein
MTPIRDWRTYLFPDTGLYDKYTNIPGKDPQVEHGVGHLMWQAMALYEVLSTDPQMSLEKARQEDPHLDQRVVDMVIGMGIPGIPVSADYHRSGLLMNNKSANLQTENPVVQGLVPALRKIRDQWKSMAGDNPPLTRCTAGPLRDFDYNLDGLAHYGMLPDMLQDLKNLGLPLEGLFRSAEGYIRVWERCAEVATRIQV